MSLLEIRGLSKTYPTGEAALRGVDLSLNGQEIIAVLGLSGSGKSTFLRCINRLVEPDAGVVILDEIEITSLKQGDLRRRRRQMGMIFQEFNLVERLTVLENVLSGRLGSVSPWRAITRAFSKEDINKALNLCDRVGLIDHIQKRADQLSGGQRQRVGIARALIQDPKLLLVDEPTSSLDPKIGAEIMDLMASITNEEHVPILISLHDLRLARLYSDRIVGLQDGVKVLDSKTEEVDDATIESIYKVSATDFGLSTS